MGVHPAASCFGVSLLSASLLTACLHDAAKQGTTYGAIRIDAPEVYTRERLVNDRYRQDEWLRRQLDATDHQEFGFQGWRDVRTFQGIVNRLGIQAAPADKITRFIGGSGDSSGDNSANKTSDGKNLGTKQIDSNDRGFGDKLKPAQDGTLPASNGGSSITASPIEVFRDKLAYREEIRAELFENELDDRHDLHGNTLYRLKFDSTIVPGGDTSAWAVIEVEFGAPESPEYPKIFKAWVEHLARQANQELFRLFAQSKREVKLTDRQVQELYAIANSLLVAPQNGIKVGFFPFGVFTIPFPRLPGLSSQSTAPEQLLKDAITQLIAQPGQLFRQPDDGASLLTQENGPAYLMAHFLRNDLSSDGGLADYVSIKVNHPKEAGGLPRLAVEVKGCELDTTLKAIGLEACPGYSNFLAVALDRAQVYSYAATPKEQVQRISDFSARRDATQFVLGLSALIGSVGIDNVTNYMRETQAQLQRIQRQPLIVGFSQSRNRPVSGKFPNVVAAVAAGLPSTKPDTAPSHGISGKTPAFIGETAVGWILGPRFTFQPDGRDAQFRHAPVQNALSAVISVPAWWSAASYRYRTGWIDERTGVFRADGARPGDTDGWSDPAPVTLPYNLDDLTNFLDRRGPRLNKLRPELPDNPDRPNEPFRVAVDEPARVIISGRNLWRGTVVTLGNQVSTRIAVLPDMNGIIAYFDRIEPPADWRERSQPYRGVPIRIWTSEGNEFVRTAEIHDRNIAPSLRVAPTARRWINGEPTNLAVLSSLPAGYASLKVGLRGFPAAGPEAGWVDAAEDKLTISGDGRVIAVRDITLQGSPRDVEARVDIELTPGGSKLRHIAPQRMVFYKDKDAASFRFEKDTISRTGEAFYLHLPARFTEAYPGVNAATISFRATVEGHEDIRLAVRPQWPSNPAALGAKVGLRLDNSLLPSKGDLEKAHGEGPLTVVIESVPMDEYDVPPVVGKLKIIQRKAAGQNQR